MVAREQDARYRWLPLLARRRTAACTRGEWVWAAAAAGRHAVRCPRARRRAAI
jgi:hypothetical protein